jgi:hypothetical protein
LERFEFLADLNGDPARFSSSKIRDLPDFVLSNLLGRWGAYL